MDFVGFTMETVENSDIVPQADAQSPNGQDGDRSRSKDRRRPKRQREESRERDTRGRHEPEPKVPRAMDSSSPPGLAPDLASGLTPAALSSMMSHITSMVLEQVRGSVPRVLSASPIMSDTISPVVHSNDDDLERPYVFGQDDLDNEDLESASVAGNSTLVDFLGCSQPALVSPTTQPVVLSQGVPVPTAGPSGLGSVNSSSNASLPDLGTTVADMTALFQQDDLCGADLHAALASALNGCLRKKPAENKIWELANNIKWPTNVPNLQVPLTNPEVVHAMSPVTTKFDKRLANLSVWVSKALTQIAAMLGDSGNDPGKTLGACRSELGDVLHLLVATFNCMCQVRKEHLRNTLARRDRNLSSLCTWETGVGEKNLFPFNVQSKCRDLARARQIGQPYRSDSYRSRGRSSGGSYGRGQSRGGTTRPSRPGFGRAARWGRN